MARDSKTELLGTNQECQQRSPVCLLSSKSVSNNLHGSFK